MDADAFLSQEIASSSPARLRFLLIQKAVGLCQVIEQQWQDRLFAESDQWVLRVFEILTELLDGVRGDQSPLSSKVSDIYVYLLREMLACSDKYELARLRNVREVLEIEQETWAQYVQNEYRQSQASTSSPHFQTRNDVLADEDAHSSFDFQM